MESFATYFTCDNRNALLLSELPFTVFPAQFASSQEVTLRLVPKPTSHPLDYVIPLSARIVLVLWGDPGWGARKEGGSHREGRRGDAEVSEKGRRPRAQEPGW